MKTTKHQYLQQYVEACLEARMISDQLESVFGTLNRENQVFSITPPKISELLEELVRDLVDDPQLFSWVWWWMYKCNWGTRPRHFQVEGRSYAVTELTFQQFLEIVDESHN